MGGAELFPEGRSPWLGGGGRFQQSPHIRGGQTGGGRGRGWAGQVEMGRGRRREGGGDGGEQGIGVGAGMRSRTEAGQWW